MALGPDNNPPQTELTHFEKFSYSFKKVVKSYFERPLYYTFYSGLFFAMVGFFAHYRPMPEFYVLMGILAGIEVHRIWSDYRSKNPLQ